MAITSDAGPAARTWRARSARWLAVLSGAVGLGNLGLAVLAVIEGSVAWQIALRVGAAVVFGLLAWTVIRARTSADGAGIRTTSGPWIAWGDVVDVRSSRRQPATGHVVVETTDGRSHPFTAVPASDLPVVRAFWRDAAASPGPVRS